MKFGYAFREYLEEEREWLVDENCAHIEYNRLKNVLKSCQNCKNTSSDKDQLCQCQSCPCKCSASFFICFGFCSFTVFLEWELYKLV